MKKWCKFTPADFLQLSCFINISCFILFFQFSFIYIESSSCIYHIWIGKWDQNYINKTNCGFGSQQLNLRSYYFISSFIFCFVHHSVFLECLNYVVVVSIASYIYGTYRYQNVNQRCYKTQHSLHIFFNFSKSKNNEKKNKWWFWLYIGRRVMMGNMENAKRVYKNESL